MQRLIVFQVQDGTIPLRLSLHSPSLLFFPQINIDTCINAKGLGFPVVIHPFELSECAKCVQK